MTYTITASNAGPSNATGCDGGRHVPGVARPAPGPASGAGGGTCTAAGSGNINDTVNLPAGGSVTYTASCTISASATGTLSNTATVTRRAECRPDPWQQLGDRHRHAGGAGRPVDHQDGRGDDGDSGGLGDLHDHGLQRRSEQCDGRDGGGHVPGALTCTWTCVGAGGGTCTAAGSGNINDTVNLPAGGSVTYTASCTISAAATGTLSNTATVTAPAACTDPTPGNNSATDTDTLRRATGRHVSGTKTVTGTFGVGGTITYTVTLSNTGPGPQGDNPGNEFTDVLPATVSLVSASATSGTAVANRRPTPSPGTAGSRRVAR